MHCVCGAHQQTRSLLSPSPLCLHHPIKPAHNKSEYLPKRACHRPFSPQQDHFPNKTLLMSPHPIPTYRLYKTRSALPHPHSYQSHHRLNLSHYIPASIHTYRHLNALNGTSGWKQSAESKRPTQVLL